MTSIASELSKFIKTEYLESMSGSELAFWLIHSFSPERYRNKNDIVEYACHILSQKMNNPELFNEFIKRLWGMFGEQSDSVGNVIDLRDYR